jgi:hypothetical protein
MAIVRPGCLRGAISEMYMGIPVGSCAYSQTEDDMTKGLTELAQPATGL